MSSEPGNNESRHDSGWDPPIPPPPPARQSWLDVPIARDPHNRKIAGVVAGVSAAYGFDRRTTRIAVAIGALVVPAIVALYIMSIVLLPGHPEDARSLRTILTERRRRPLLFLLAILAIGTGFGSWALFGGLGWGFALVAVGVVLWLAPNLGSSSARPASTAPPAPAAPGATAFAPTTATATTKPRRRRYPIQAVGLAAASVGALVVGIGNSADWWSVSTYAVVLGVLATLVTVTIAGVIVNRSWFGIPMLLMLVPWTVGLVITHPNLDGGIGDRTFRPTTVADAQVEQNLGIGRLTMDLTHVPFGEQTLMVDAHVGYGQVRVIVPDDTEVRIVSDVNVGHVVVNGQETSAGLRRDDTLTVPAKAATGARHTMVLDVGLGAGEVNLSQVG